MKHLVLTCAVVAGLMASPVFAASETATVYAAVQKGQWAEAETLLRQGLAQNPNDPERLLNLAYVLQNTGRGAEAVKLYGQVLQLERNPVVAIGDSDQVRAKALARRRIASLVTAP